MDTFAIRYGKLSVNASATLKAVANGDPYAGITNGFARAGRTNSLGALLKRGIISINRDSPVFRVTKHGHYVMMMGRQVPLPVRAPRTNT
jgi:hypothetical protein